MRAPGLLLTLSAWLLLSAAGDAEARCPRDGWPSRAVCKPVNAFFVPGLAGHGYFPDQGPRWLGAGVTIAAYQWSHPSESFGPGAGRLAFDIALLDVGDHELTVVIGRMLLWRVSGQASFERNPSRAFAVPYFVAGFGAVSADGGPDTGFIDAGLGLYLVQMARYTVAVEGTRFFPFSDVDALVGWRGGLVASATLW